MPELEGGIAVESGNETEAGSPPVPEGAEEHEEQGKPSKRSQKVKRLSEKLTAAERERDEAREELARLRAGRGEQPSEQAKSSQFDYPVPKPKLENFTDPAAFVEEMADWKADKREWEYARKSEAEERQVTDRELKERHNERVDEARERYDDWDEVIENAPNVVCADQLCLDVFERTVAESEDGPDIMYYLGTHPEEIKKFRDLTPHQVAAQVGRIAAKLPAHSEEEAPPEEEKRRPAVIKPVGGSARPSAVDRNKLSFLDYKKARQAGKIK